MNSVRKCVRKPLGGSISAEEGIIEEKIVLNIRATGKEKYISLNAQIQSCGMCNKVKLACKKDFELSNGKCSSTILATADPLIVRDDITIRATRDRLHCSSPNDPSMGSNLTVTYKAYITGKSTIQPGDLKIDFVFEGSDWMKNPCEGDNISGLQNRKCKRIDDKLHIEMNNEMSIDAVNYLVISSKNELVITIIIEPKDTCTTIDQRMNMTSTTTIDHPLYEDRIVLPFKDVQSYHLLAVNDPTQAGLGIWITIGVSAFILLMFVVAACVRYHRKKPTTHQAQLIDNPKENAEKSILVTE